MQTFDLAVVGGGIVGLATAYQFSRRFPGRRVVVLEKETRVAEHQTGHNSGVLHSGIYYKPGTLKASTCRAGKKAMEAFCAAEGIAHDICGKVIVAVDEAELPALERIYERGQGNGVDCAMIGKDRLAELESRGRPMVARGGMGGFGGFGGRGDGPDGGRPPFPGGPATPMAGRGMGRAGFTPPAATGRGDSERRVADLEKAIDELRQDMAELRRSLRPTGGRDRGPGR